MRSHLLWTVASVALLNGGCGTAVNTVWLAPFEGGQRVYGGVRADLGVMRELASGETGMIASGEPVKMEPGERLRKLFFLSLDLPLSAVGDTLTLPYTIPVSVRRGINEYYFPPETPKAIDGP